MEEGAIPAFPLPIVVFTISISLGSENDTSGIFQRCCLPSIPHSGQQNSSFPSQETWTQLSDYNKTRRSYLTLYFKRWCDVQSSPAGDTCAVEWSRERAMKMMHTLWNLWKGLQSVSKRCLTGWLPVRPQPWGLANRSPSPEDWAPGSVLPAMPWG